MKPKYPKSIVASLVMLTCILGVIGFGEALPERDPLTLVYLTLQLFLLKSGSVVETNVPWTLEIARWLSAGLFFTAILTGLWVFLKKSAGKFKLSRLRDHTIIFGGGSTVRSALDPADTSNTVLISADRELIERWQARGGLAIGIDEDAAAIETDHLQDAGLRHASRLISLDPDDNANLRAGLLAQSMITSRQASVNTRIIVRQDTPATRDLIQRNGLLTSGPGQQLLVISIETTRARLLLMHNPLERTSPGGLATEVHLALPRVGTFEQAVAVQAALTGHYAGGKKVHLWLESEGNQAKLLADYPGIRECVHLHRLEENKVPSFADLSTSVPAGSCVTILATDTTPEAGFVRALQYRENWNPEACLRVILSGPLSHQAGQGNDADTSDDTPHEEWLCHAPCPNDPAIQKALFDDQLDRTARAIHETWHHGNQQRIDQAVAAGDEHHADALRTKPTFKPWQQLTEYQKDLNRAAADHIEIKIRAVGLDPGQPDLKEVWDNLSADQLEILSRMEHERWTAPLWLNGYKPGERDDTARMHPNLVPFDDLDQSTKDYDTEQVRQAAGYHLAAKEGG
jgi:hypothetical protein